jgi:hypothetical protein
MRLLIVMLALGFSGAALAQQRPDPGAARGTPPAQGESAEDRGESGRLPRSPTDDPAAAPGTTLPPGSDRMNRVPAVPRPGDGGRPDTRDQSR